MTASEWIAVAGLAVTVIGAIGGAAWWMSALYARVSGIGDHVTIIDEKLGEYIADGRNDRQTMWAAIHDNLKTLHAVELRIAKLESVDSLR